VRGACRRVGVPGGVYKRARPPAIRLARWYSLRPRCEGCSSNLRKGCAFARISCQLPSQQRIGVLLCLYIRWMGAITFARYPTKANYTFRVFRTRLPRRGLGKRCTIFLAQGAEGGNTERVACGNIVVSSRRSEAFGTEESFILNITCNNGALLGRGA